MHGLRRTLFSAVPVLFASPALAQGEPVVMAPTSAWNIDYADDSCALRRAFEGGGERALFELRQFGPGAGFQVLVASDTLSVTRRPPRVRFDPDEDFVEPMAPFYFNGAESDGLIYNDYFSPNALKPVREQSEESTRRHDPARERAITGLSIKEGFVRPITLQIGPMHEPMEAMRVCLDELLNHWGLDPAVQRTLSRSPQPIDFATWGKRIAQRYPPEMAAGGVGSVVHVRLVVGADGKPTACIPHADSPSLSADEEACRVLMREARFEPALDANGEPVGGYYTNRVIFQVAN